MKKNIANSTEDAANQSAGNVSNKKLEEYILDYISYSSIEKYAVMISGPWGSGKTYFINNFIRNKSDLNFAYISLHGISNKHEFDQAILSAIYPFINSRIYRGIKKLTQTAVSYFGVSAEFAVEEFLSHDKNVIFIFDDLERCEISAHIALAHISQIISKRPHKCIILSNENEINKKERTYQIHKEKVVCQTLMINSDINSALDSFIDKTDNIELKSFLQKYRLKIILAASESGYNNLRLVDHLIFDFFRFYQVIPLKYKKRDEALSNLLYSFFVFGLELKSGNLNREDIIGNGYIIPSRSANADRQESKISKISKKYSTNPLNLISTPRELFVDIFVTGTIEPDDVTKYLSTSSAFTEIEDIPSWRIVWDKENYDEELVLEAIDDMLQKFYNRNYDIDGEILHVCAIFTSLSKENIIDINISDAISECKAYINQIFSIKEVTNWNNSGFYSYQSYSGLGYIGRESEEFKEILDHFKLTKAETFNLSLPEKAQALLQEMKDDISLFCRRINISDSNESLYYNIPILNYISPNLFVETLTSMPASSQRSILFALNARYKDGKLERDFSDEQTWLMSIRDKLEEAATTASPVEAARIRKILRWSINSILEGG